MKSNILVWGLCMLMINCTVKEEPFSPSLIKLVDDMIKRSDRPVIIIQASEINGHNLIFLTSSMAYDPDFLDGYYIYKDRLITYFQTDSINRCNLVNQKYLQNFKDSIHGFRNVYFGISEPIEETFEVNGKQIVRVRDARRLMIVNKKTNKNNIFINKYLEHTLLEYIHNNPSVLYEVRFWQENMRQYVFWRPMPFYDKDKYDGYFFLGKQLVVLYGTKYAGKLLKNTWIKRGQTIPKFRYNSIKDWNFPFPVKLEVLSDGKIKTLSVSDGFFLRDSL